MTDNAISAYGIIDPYNEEDDSCIAELCAAHELLLNMEAKDALAVLWGIEEIGTVRRERDRSTNLANERAVIIAERDATIAALKTKIDELEATLSDYEPSSGEFERVRAIGYGNESARLATEAAGEPSEWDIYTKQMVEIAEYADWEIRDYRRDLEKVRRYAESGVHHAVIQAAATNALLPVRRNFLPPPPVPDEGL